MSNTPQPHRATPEDWAWVERDLTLLFSCLLELRARVEALEAGVTCPEYTSDQFCRLAEQRAAQPAPPAPAPATAGSLVEQLQAVVRPSGGFLADDEWRLVIRAVAGWLRQRDSRVAASVQIAGVLEQEAAR